ncbi:hypothetical protein KAU32_05875 [bacterium]|nr:hypothetical protein [bacterium]
MRKITVLFVLIMFHGGIFCGNLLRTDIPVNTSFYSALDIQVISSSVEIGAKGLSFVQEEHPAGRSYVGFGNDKIKLVYDIKKIKETLSDLNLASGKMIIFAHASEEKKAKDFSQKCSDAGLRTDVSIEETPISFIKGFKEKGSQYEGIIIFQDSPLLTRSNQQLIATLIISIKKVLITLGISDKAPGILSFTPSEEKWKKALNEFYTKGSGGKLTLSQVNFNLRYAAIIGLQFKTEFLAKVKRVI